MAFTAQDVKKLREMTNVGMMDCKKALTASDGDMDKAVEWLREKGLAAAAKKSGRIAAEGAVKAIVKDGVGAIVEVNAETDFASNSDKFQEFISDVADAVAESNPADLDALLHSKYPGTDKTIEEILPEKIRSSARTSRSAALPATTPASPSPISTWAAALAFWST